MASSTSHSGQNQSPSGSAGSLRHLAWYTRGQLAAEHLALAVAQPAVEVVPAVLRGRVHGVRVERRLLGVIEGAVSQL